MHSKTLEADYLVIGSGAMGMAFTDTLMTETGATVVMVDRHHQPGGHWNDAYSHVRLHQPSAFYGVNSKKLGSDTLDTTGWNEGLYELATDSEVCAYFDQVMQRQFLASGRVQYFPMCEYTGDKHFHSLVSDEQFSVVADKVVNATYMNVTVPSMRAPAYEVAQGATCLPPNALPRVAGQYDRYVIVGAGKTGMDACLFLLKNGVDPDNIAWVMPRDSWILDRANIQPLKFQEQTFGGFAQEMEVIAQAESLDDLFDGVNGRGRLLRLDENVRPTMYRCATVTMDELAQLRRINEIIRLGRVKSINTDTIVFDEGTVATSPTTLHVDCSADGLERRPIEPIFANQKITLQSVRTCQQVFSAAFIGHVEASYDDDAIKNELCTPLPHPDTDIDFLRTSLANTLNGARWAQDEGLQSWLQEARLDGFTASDSSANDVDPQVVESTITTVMGAIQNLQKLLAEIDA